MWEEPPRMPLYIGLVTVNDSKKFNLRLTPSFPFFPIFCPEFAKNFRLGDTYGRQEEKEHQIKNGGRTILSIYIYIFVFHLNVWPLGPENRKLLWRFIVCSQFAELKNWKQPHFTLKHDYWWFWSGFHFFGFIFVFNDANYNLPIIIFVYDKWYLDFGFVSWRQKWKKMSSNWKMKSVFNSGKSNAKRNKEEKNEQTKWLHNFLAHLYEAYKLPFHFHRTCILAQQIY